MNFKLKILSAFCMVLFLNACSSNNEKVAIEKSAINEMQSIDSILNMQVVEWNSGKISGYMKGYWKSDSLRFVTKRGVVKGWNNVNNMYNKGFDSKEKMGVLVFEIYEKTFINQEQTTANIIGKFRVNKILKNQNIQDTGMFSLVFRKIDQENWKIIIDHTY